MVRMSIAEALERIRQGCTELNLECARRGAPSPPPLAAPPHAHARVQERGRAARQPRAHAARALAAPTPRVRPPRVPQAMTM